MVHAKFRGMHCEVHVIRPSVLGANYDIAQITLVLPALRPEEIKHWEEYIAEVLTKRTSDEKIQD